MLTRSKHRCEFCGVRNYLVGYRDEDGVFHEIPNGKQGWLLNGHKMIRIVLTIAHLDHDPTHNDGYEATGKLKRKRTSNRRSLCQRCHNRFDIKHRVATRRGYEQTEMDLEPSSKFKRMLAAVCSLLSTVRAYCQEAQAYAILGTYKWPPEYEGVIELPTNPIDENPFV